MLQPDSDDPEVISLTIVQGLIEEVCDEIKAMLLDKNKQYGNSAIEPRRIFSKADPEEQIKVRIDDKLSRIANGAPGEDSEKDLIGYLVLLRVCRRYSGKKTTITPTQTDPLVNCYEGAIVSRPDGGRRP